MGNSRVFWARCYFTGPKKLSNSRARPSPTCPSNGYARINHRCINSYCTLPPFSSTSPHFSFCLLLIVRFFLLSPYHNPSTVLYSISLSRSCMYCVLLSGSCTMYYTYQLLYCIFLSSSCAKFTFQLLYCNLLYSSCSVLCYV
jgi:hypothetical protein